MTSEHAPTHAWPTGPGAPSGDEDARSAGHTSVSEMKPGIDLDLEPTGIAHGGVAVARHEGRVVFVADAIPGERVRARVTEVKKSFARAAAIEPLEPNEHRLPHVWAEADIARDPEDRAGGAEFGHMDLLFQRELKGRVIAEAMQKFGGLENWVAHPITVEAMPGDDEVRGTGWRTRVTLHVDEEGRVGPYAARSRRVIEVASLPLAFPDLQELAPLDGRLPRLGAPGASGATSRLGTGEGELRGPGRIDLVAPSQLESRMRVRLEGGPRPRPAGVIAEVVGDLEFELDEDGFWQVHRHAARALAEVVRELSRERLDPEGQHLDLYGGVGLFAACFADAGARYVETVESAARATQHARRNLVRWRGPSAVTGRVDRYLNDLEREVTAADRADLEAGTILLDPPRAGAGAGVVRAIAAFRPRQIIYVACDPVALARDTSTLRECGYDLDVMRALDLFPNTHHVECVARFLPADGS